MLRIQRTDVMVHRVVLLLQGYIVSEWAQLLERECEQLIGSGLRVVLDLSAVAFIGDSGIQVLRRLHNANVEIVRCPPLIAKILEHAGIDVGRDSDLTSTEDDAGNHTPRKHRNLPSTRGRKLQ